MKKRICVIVLVLTLFSTGATFEPGAALLPEVAMLVQIQELDEATLRQNGYVGLIGLEAPAEMDYVAIGSHVVRDRIQALRQALIMRGENNNSFSSQESDSPEKYYDGRAPLSIFFPSADFFPCGNIGKHHCIAQTVTQEETISVLTKRNAESIRRYLEIQKKPYWETYHHAVVGLDLQYSGILFLMRLRLNEAILAFSNGGIDEGFNILSQEQDFAKKILASKGPTIDKVIATVMLFSSYHIIEALLGQPFMRPYLNDSRLARLLTPLTEQQQRAFSEAIKYDRDSMTYILLLSNAEAIEEVLSDNEIRKRLPDPKADVGKLAKQLDCNEIANLNHLFYAPIIAKTARPIHEMAISRQQTTKSLSEIARDSLKVQPAAAKQTSSQTEIALIIIDALLPEYETMLNPFYDLQVYRSLINVKQHLLKSGIDVNDSNAVNAFLAHADWRNPYTGLPFEWDQQQLLIWAPALSKRFLREAGKEDLEYLAVHVW